MRTFAQIQNKRVHWIFDSEEAPDFAPNIHIVEITGKNPMPQEGWGYEDGVFKPPVVPPVTTISTTQFKLALNQKGYFEIVDNWAQGSETSNALTIVWNTSSTVDRNGPLVQFIIDTTEFDDDAAMLELPPIDDAVMDEIFALGATLNDPDLSGLKVFPYKVSKAQAKVALMQAGLLLEIESYISGLDKTNPAQYLIVAGWEETQQFNLYSPLIKTLASKFNLSKTDVDNLFIAASKVKL